MCLRVLLLAGLVVTFRVMAVESICHGTTSDGWLENGVELPASGSNFVTYTRLADLLGRTYVHSAVRDIVIEAYQGLEKEQPGKVFKYAETGFREGGEFRPHRTHRNGLSVDFIVPVLDQSGHSVHLPTHLFNKFGYNIEFDQIGHYDEYRIDYEALAAHLVLLHRSAVSRGHDLWRVIFAQELQPFLYQTRYGDYLQTHIEFYPRPAWVRHDEHYHVDFAVECVPVE